jgi:hypothetical protein
MANTYTLISSNVLSSSAASVTFSAIPATYTDLVIRYSARSTDTGSYETFVRLEMNGGSATHSSTVLRAQGGSVGSLRSTSLVIAGYIPTATATSDTFGSAEFYLPNYLSTIKKTGSHYGVQENNSATNASIAVTALLVDVTTAVTDLLLKPNAGDFVSTSSFYLYGISNA